MATATPYQQLEQEFRRLHAFRGVLSLLRWDAAVTMPRASADLRGDQLAALEIETHTLLVSPRISRLLDRADANAQSLAGWQAANLARDAPAPRPRDRDAAVADRAHGQGLRPRRGALARGARGERLQRPRAAARRDGQARAQQGGAPRPALLARALGCARRRIHAGPPRARHRDDLHAARAAPAGPRDGGDRAAGRGACAADRRPLFGQPPAQHLRRRHEGARLPVRPRPLRRERPSVHRGRAGRHPRRDQVRAEGSVPGPARRAARDGPGALRPRPAVGMGGPARRPGPRHGDGGEPVAAARDGGGQEPRLRHATCGRCSRSITAPRARNGRRKTSTATSIASRAARTAWTPTS